MTGGEAKVRSEDEKQQQDREKEEIPNVLEEKKLHSSRKAKLGQLTHRKNIVLELMKDVANIDEVKENMFKYYALVREFKDAHSDCQKLLNYDDRDNDTDNWFKTKTASVGEFNAHVNNWLSNPPEMTENDGDEDVTNDKDAKAVVDVAPHESVSQVSSKVSSTASSRTRAEAEKAALEAKFNALMEEHALEDEEEMLNRQKEQIRKRKEALELRDELEAASAKISVFSKNMETPEQVQNKLEDQNQCKGALWTHQLCPQKDLISAIKAIKAF